MTESPRLSPMPRRIRDSSVAPSQGDSPISATPTSAFLRRLPLSPAVASSANSYESPTIPSALSSTLQDSDLVSPRSISSNPYAKLSSATPQSPSISVGRSSSTGRSLKEKTGGFLSRLFSSRSKSRERDRGREKDRVRDHPRETSLSSKGSIPSIDNVRFQHVKAVDARTSTKKLISPSNNDFAVMFPSMVRPKDDVPASADTGFKVYIDSRRPSLSIRSMTQSTSKYPNRTMDSWSVSKYTRRFRYQPRKCPVASPCTTRKSSTRVSVTQTIITRSRN
ncbi:hypothetical protein BJ741DRAFT_13473 [Chytriomyces cf. hyalinus JEL632]|nr:hypothetical protein BJ741DRAFT_13473 [Chytriomyces cf. hyalinus JEL632]